MSRRSMVVAFALGALNGACTDDGGATGFTPTPTSIEVDPREFLGDVPCSPAQGGMKSYVATLFDMSVEPEAGEVGGGFELPSSAPTPCTEAVQFRFVVPGHEYSAEIQGFEQPPEDLQVSALDCKSAPNSGSSHMCVYDADEEKLVPAEPRWTGDCGAEGPAPEPGESSVPTGAIAVLNSIEVVRNCTPLHDDGEPAPPGAIVDPNVTLTPPLACVSERGQGGGTIESFDILPTGLAPQVNVPCGSIPQPYSGLVAGATYDFRVEAHDVDPQAPRRAARCWVVPEVDLVRTATCEPLSDVGTLRLAPLEDAIQCLTGDQFIARVVRADEDGGPALDLGPFPCEMVVEVATLDEGSYEIELSSHPSKQPLGTCAADVIPAATTTADCSPAP